MAGTKNSAGTQIVSPVIAPASIALPSHTTTGAVTIPAPNHANTDSAKSAQVTGKSSTAHPPEATKPPPGIHNPTPAACIAGDIPKMVGSSPSTHKAK